METALKIFKQTSWQLFGKTLTALSTLLVLSLVGRYLGVEKTGVFTLSLSLLAFFYLAADFGLNAHVMQKLVGGETREWRSLLGLRLVWAGILTLVLTIFAVFYPGLEVPFRQAVLTGSLAVIAYAVFATCNALFQAKLRYDLSILPSVLGALPTVGLVYVAVQYDWGINGAVLAHMVGWVVCAIAALFIVRKFSSIAPLFGFKYILKVTREAWPISATLVLNMVYFRIDAFILSYLKGFYDVGIYNLSFQIFQLALVLPTFIVNSLYPVLIKHYKKGKREFTDVIIKSSFVMFNLALAATLVTFFTAPFLTGIIGGDRNFIGSAEALQILSLSFPAFFVSTVLMWSLVVLKEYKYILAIYSLGLLVNIGLNFLLIPRFSYLAASWVTGISEYLILILQLTILTKALAKR